MTLPSPSRHPTRRAAPLALGVRAARHGGAIFVRVAPRSADVLCLPSACGGAVVDAESPCRRRRRRAVAVAAVSVHARAALGPETMRGGRLTKLHWPLAQLG